MYDDPNSVDQSRTVNPGVTGFSGNDQGTNSNTRNFAAPGAGEGDTGFAGSNTGHGTTGFDRTGGQGDGSGPGNLSANPNENISGFSGNDPRPSSHGAAFEAPGTGEQKTGFSNVSGQGYTGFEASHGSSNQGGGGYGDDNAGSGGGGGLKEKLSSLKDKVTSD